MILGKKHIKALSPAWMPFAEASSANLPVAQLLRLSSFDPDDTSRRGRVVYPPAFDGL